MASCVVCLGPTRLTSSSAWDGKGSKHADDVNNYWGTIRMWHREWRLLTPNAAEGYCGYGGACIDLSDLPGYLRDEVGVSMAFGGCAARALPGCHVFRAMGVSHSIRELLRHVSGPSLPSTRTCSNRCSLSSRAESRSRSV